MRRPAAGKQRLEWPALLAAVLALALFATGDGRAGPERRAGKLRWVRHAPLSQSRAEAAYARTGDNIYAIAGFGPAFTTLPTVEVYDVDADRWSDGPPLPIPVNHAMATSSDDVVYVAGGYLAAVFGATNSFFALDDGRWRPLPPMPETRAAGGAAAIDGRIYIVGGFTQQGVMSNSTLVYDIERGEWATEVPLPTPREHLSVAVYRGSIYALGGRAGDVGTNMTVVERFDPETGDWARLAPMLAARSGHASAATRNGFIVTLGGEGAGGPFDTAEAYDVARESSFRLPSLTSPRTGLGIAALGARVYTFFGAGRTGLLEVTESIDVSPLRPSSARK